MTTTDISLPSEEIQARLDGPVHMWFGLSYSNYQVLHRALMQSMPVEWQRRMVACLEELRDAFHGVEQATSCEVHPCRWVEPCGMSGADMTRTGVTYNEETDTYYDGDGNELEKYSACVAVPVAEPVPHYNRGRTFIPTGR